MVNAILLDLGFWQLRWYSVLFVIGLILSYFIILKIAQEKGHKKELFERFFLWGVISIIIGARLFEVLFYEPSYYLSNPLKIFYVWEGGLASHGAIIGLILVSFIFARRNKLHFYDLADIIVIPCGLAAAFVRLGNFFNGELVGKITDFFTGMKFRNYSGLRHPVQLYQAVSNLVIFGFMYRLRKLKQGVLFWMFLFLYSILRFFTEFYKEMELVFLGLNLAQLLSILIFITSIVFLIKLKAFSNKSS